MKTIILATDFSKNAQSASDFALQLAQLLKTRLILLTIYHHPLPLLQAVFTPLEEKNKQSARRKLYRLRDRLKKAGEETVPISVLARQGDTLATIEAVAKEQKADLLIMGTAGSRLSGFRYFGSQATEMILRTPVPLLLVPPKARFIPFKNIVVAIDLSKTVSAGALNTVVRFATLFDAFLTILCVSENSTDPALQQTAEGIRNLLKKRAHTVSLVKGDDLSQTILRFSAESHANLVMMLPKSRNRFLFSILESNTQELARHPGFSHRFLINTRRTVYGKDPVAN